VIERGLLATKSSNWLIVVRRLLRAGVHLLSLGVGLGALVGSVSTTTGRPVSYAAFMAPALLTRSPRDERNVYDSTSSVFFKMRTPAALRGQCSRRPSARWMW
jgi:lipooligosaccharide transport system permease protein